MSGTAQRLPGSGRRRPSIGTVLAVLSGVTAVLFLVVMALGWNSGPEGKTTPMKKPASGAKRSKTVAARQGAEATKRTDRSAINHAGPRLWDGLREEAILARMRKQRIRKVSFNRAGSSLTFRLFFHDGSSAAYKPDQYHDGSRPRKEIAAYRINCALGLHRVPPATSRVIPLRKLLRRLVHSDHDLIPRIRKEARVWYGLLRGEVSWWIPKIRYLRINTRRARQEYEGWLDAARPLPPDKAEWAAQISTMIVFDYVINNVDRFTGGNTMTTADGKFLYFMDNTFSFFPTPRRNNENLTRLRRVQRFSARLYRALKRLTPARLSAEIAKEGKAPWPILYRSEFNAVIRRKDTAVNHIEKVIAEFGRKKALSFP